MKILAFSINPIFPDLVLGGAPRQLEKIARHLGAVGHEVGILCTEIPDRSREPFALAEGVWVYPELPFRQPFPAPYAIPPYRLAEAFQRIADRLEQADRFYVHDGELLLPALQQRVPTVVSLRDNVYPETLLGSYLCQGDRLVFVSQYSRALYLATTGRFYPELDARSEVIPNGLEFDHFAPTAPDAVYRIVGEDVRALRARGARVLLHPHRPDPTKGLPQTLDVADRLRRHHGWEDFVVLVPCWPDAASGQTEATFQREMNARIAALGLERNVRFHPWVPRALMPQYYGIGDVTLSLGSFPETFGNAVYESLACGTASLATRVATHRSLLPDALLDKVHFGDTEGSAAIIDRITRESSAVPAATMRYLREHYDAHTQVEAYAEVILGATPQPPLAFDPLALERAAWQLAPWCYASERGFFHDFHGEFRSLPRLRAALERATSDAMIDTAGLDAEELHTWCRDGYIVPVRLP